jgi:hypothetical protein
VRAHAYGEKEEQETSTRTRRSSRSSTKKRKINGRGGGRGAAAARSGADPRERGSVPPQCHRPSQAGTFDAREGELSPRSSPPPPLPAPCPAPDYVHSAGDTSASDPLRVPPATGRLASRRLRVTGRPPELCDPRMCSPQVGRSCSAPTAH